MNQTMNQPHDDPWDEIDNPQVRTREYWGQVAVGTWYCVLEKGAGKVPFNAQVHAADRRCTAIDIVITPIAEMNTTRNVERSMIRESPEYTGLVLPSIHAMGVQARELNNRFVRVGFQPTGRTYVDKNSGETRNSTTLKFLTVFADEAACRADYLANRAGGNAATPPWTEPAEPAAPAAGPNGNGKERETALKFARVVVQNACAGQKDLEVIRNTIAVNFAQMPMVGKYVSADSAEVSQMIVEAMTK